MFAAQRNRGNQLNPTHHVFYTSRHLGSDAERSGFEWFNQRANAMNPNNRAFRGSSVQSCGDLIWFLSVMVLSTVLFVVILMFHQFIDPGK